MGGSLEKVHGLNIAAAIVRTRSRTMQVQLLIIIGCTVVPFWWRPELPQGATGCHWTGIVLCCNSLEAAVAQLTQLTPAGWSLVREGEGAGGLRGFVFGPHRAMLMLLA